MDPTKQKLIDMLIRYGIKGETDVAQIPYQPQKTAPLSHLVPKKDLPRATPESVGVSSAHLTDLVEQIEKRETAAVHNLLILRRDRVIAEASAPGYSTSTWCLTHSMAKSITALAVGLLVDDGRLSLSTRASDVLYAYCPDRMDEATKALTVWHLLSMSAGITSISEASSVLEDKWLRAFFSGTPVFAPGSQFRYNSMNTYVLSAMVTKITGAPLSELLLSRLFRPMGIRHFFAERGPEGIEKGGWGMYIAPEDLVKLGLLFLHGGIWKGKRLISQSWLSLMGQTAQVTADSYGSYDYGLHTWVARDKSAVLFSGMLGQNLWICPEKEVVVAVTAGNGELFQKQAILELLERYLGRVAPLEQEPLPENKKDRRRLLTVCHGFASRYTWAKAIPSPSPFRRFWNRLRGRNSYPLPASLTAWLGDYLPDKNNAGLLPLFVRFMQNNHTEGITSVSFFTVETRSYATFREGQTPYTFEIGWYAPALTELCFRGEYYTVAVQGELGRGEDGEPCLRLEIRFPELPNVRRILITSEGDGLRLALSEAPGRAMIDELIATHVPETLRGGGIAAFVRTKLFGVDPLKSIGPATEPVLTAHRVPTASTEAPKAKESARP